MTSVCLIRYAAVMAPLCATSAPVRCRILCVEWLSVLHVLHVFHEMCVWCECVLLVLCDACGVVIICRQCVVCSMYYVV